MNIARMPSACRLFVEAGRNLFANKRRTAAMLASLVCGVLSLFLVGGYYQYTYWGLAQSLIRSQYGHIDLYEKGYRASRDIDPFAHPIERLDELLGLLRADPEVELAAPRAFAFATAHNAATGDSAVVEARGVDPDIEAELFTFYISKRGSWMTNKDGLCCQMAPALAKKLKLGLDDEATINVVRADDQFNTQAFRVKTLVGSYSEELDGLAVQMPARAFSELFGFSGAQQIAILLRDGAEPERKAASLRKQLSAAGYDLEVRLWYEDAAYFKQVLSYFQGYYSVVILMVAMLALFVVGATVSLGLGERLREFGTRIGMGESRGRVAAAILAEALLAGILGLAAGIVLAFASGYCINRSGGITMPAAPGLTTALKVLIFYSPQAALYSLALCLLAPPLAAAIPARSVLKMSVVRLLNRGRGE
jgi:putative ABC transport system permease protein